MGAGAIGEIFFFLPQVQIPELCARIRAAEATVPVTTSRTGRVYRTTTRLRSEAGAIKSIEILPAAEKRLFSAATAVQSFLDPHTFPGYQVELFEVPPLNAIETDRWGRRQLFESLFTLLLSLGNGARSTLLPAVGRIPMLELQLTRSSDAPALIDLSQLAVTSAGLPGTTPEVDPSIERHDRALACSSGRIAGVMRQASGGWPPTGSLDGRDRTAPGCKDRGRAWSVCPRLVALNR